MSLLSEVVAAFLRSLADCSAIATPTFIFISIFVLILFFLVCHLLSNHIELALLRLKCTLCHIGEVRGRVRDPPVASSLLDLILRDLKDPKELCQILHRVRILRRQVLHLLHSEQPRVQFG